MKLTPLSIAACSVRIDSSSSTVPHEPPMAHAPKLIVETDNPVLPNARYCITQSCGRIPTTMNRTFVVSLAVAAACAAVGAQAPSGLTSDALKGLPLRTLGPDITTGRVSDVDID